MKLQNVTLALGTIGIGLVYQVVYTIPAQALTWSFTNLSDRGSAANNGTSIGAFTDIVPSYIIDSSSITYTAGSSVTSGILNIGSEELEFSDLDPTDNSNSPEFFASIPSIATEGSGSFKVSNIGYVNNILTVTYNGSLAFNANNLNSNVLKETITGTIYLPNFLNLDPSDLSTYLQGNLGAAALNNSTLSSSESWVISNGTSFIKANSSNLVAAIIPFDFNFAEGVALGIPLFIALRILKKRKAFNVK